MTIYRSINPADHGDVVTTVDLGDAGAFVAACERAAGARRGWASVPAPVRGRVIERIGRLTEANAETLARLVTREVGKPLTESRGEVREVIDTCSFFAGEGRRLYGMTVPSELPDKHLFTFRRPHGVVAVITAGNFPVAVPSWYIVPALLCGNTVVWKPAPHAAACAGAFAAILRAAGVPEETVQVVHADGPTTGAGLEAALAAGVVDKVGFTGSTEVGRHIGALCGRHLQRPCLELGGKNPMVVMPDADPDAVLAGAMFSAWATAGQRCTSLGTLWAHEDVADALLERFRSATEQMPVGDPTAEVVYGPLMDERFSRRFEGWLEMVEDHHRVVGSTGTGRIGPANPRSGFVGDPERGWYHHPSIVVGIRPGDRLYDTETFGPIVGFGTFGHLDEAIELCNGTGYGLSASIYTADPDAAFRFVDGVGAGMVSINNSTVGAEAHLPFGGNGRSGNGARQSGVWVLEEMTRWEAVNWDHSGRLQRAQMDVADLVGDPGFRLDPGGPPPADDGG